METFPCNIATLTMATFHDLKHVFRRFQGNSNKIMVYDFTQVTIFTTVSNVKIKIYCKFRFQLVLRFAIPSMSYRNI